MLDRLDDTVGRHGRAAQLGRHLGDGLVVPVAHDDDVGAEDRAQARPLLELDPLVDEQVVAVRAVVKAVLGDVGQQRPAEGDVDELVAAADAEHRGAVVDRAADRLHAELVGVAVDAVLVRHRASHAVDLAVDVAAAEEQHGVGVEHVADAGEVAGRVDERPVGAALGEHLERTRGEPAHEVGDGRREVGEVERHQHGHARPGAGAGVGGQHLVGRDDGTGHGSSNGLRVRTP